MLQSKPFVKDVSLYQSRVLLDKYRGYVEVYTENMAEQMSRMKHLLTMAPSGRVSQLSNTHISSHCLPQLLQFLIFPPSGSPESSTRAEEMTFLKAIQLGCLLQIQSPHLQIHSQSK